ncbi:MAG: class I SAM-dependent methyltransferase [Abditibacteriales bacterium]|nr:class I SAM-dependent methyltransferase [Abditibacteriales bacterium]
MMHYLKSFLKFWVPAGVLELYRNSRGNQPQLVVESMPYETQFLLPKRSLVDIFPGIESIVVNITVSQVYEQDEWMMPLKEMLTLAAICRYVQPRTVFEIGTYRGASTLLIAMNTPDDTEIFTLDLDPSERIAYKENVIADAFPQFTVGEAYQNTSFAFKVHQLLGNSLNFDYGPYIGAMDFVFVDGDHSYEFVKSDTEKAFQLIHPGGVILWDDYLWDRRHPECAGVTRCLNEIKDSGCCFQIDGTRFAIYVDPRAGF